MKIKPTISDISLIQEIQTNECSPCIKEIRNRHIGLIISIYKRYSYILHSFYFSNEDFNQEIDYIIFEAARSFDLKNKKIKFSTWLGERVRFFCLNKINELKKNKSISSEPETITKLIDDCINNKDNSKECREIYEYLMNILGQIKDKRVPEIFRMRYFSGKNKMTWKEIGQKINLTSQSCINIHNKNLKILKDKLTSKLEFDRI